MDRKDIKDKNADRKQNRVLKSMDQRKKDWDGRLSLPEANDQNEPGSIEQQLDMVENAPGPRGDSIIRDKGKSFDDKRDPNYYKELDGDEMLTNFHLTMEESNREGDEASGDEHSAGLQGGESELATQPELDEDIPGDETRIEEKREKRKAS